jgi:putative FmdB family regulatory protein
MVKRPFYRCEDCGHEFEQFGFPPDIEESPLACPACGGLDIELVEERGPTSDADAT